MIKHTCSIHKETFIFLRLLYSTYQRKQSIKQILYIIKFIKDKDIFTKQDIALQFKISDSTLNKYLMLLKELKLCKAIKRTENEIKDNVMKQYSFVNQIYLKEVLFLIKHKLMCPIFCMPKDIIDDDLFIKMGDYLK